jgi:tRNA-dihydrouridine synthase 2
MIEWTRVPSNPQNSALQQQQQQQQQQSKMKKDKLDEPPRETLIYRLDPTREAGRLIFQIGTSDPDRAVAAARLVATDVAGIDVNAGCPKPFSTSGGMGAALLRTPDRLCAILRALVANITPEFQIGISVKIRLLETPAETEALVRALVATGITGLTVHCRTTPMRPRERAIRGQLRMVAGVCREAGVACLMNGDIENRDQAMRLVEEFETDGAMIATAAEKNPSCFRTAEQGGLASWREVVEQYVVFAMEVENRFGNTKYLLNQMIPGKEPVYRRLASAKCYTQACEVLGFAHLADRAREADANLGILPLSNEEVGKGGKEGKKRLPNGVALAACGKMAEARSSGTSSQPRKKVMSERGVKATAIASGAAVTAVSTQAPSRS